MSRKRKKRRAKQGGRHPVQPSAEDPARQARQSIRAAAEKQAMRMWSHAVNREAARKAKVARSASTLGWFGALALGALAAFVAMAVLSVAYMWAMSKFG